MTTPNYIPTLIKILELNNDLFGEDLCSRFADIAFSNRESPELSFCRTLGNCNKCIAQDAKRSLIAIYQVTNNGQQSN